MKITKILSLLLILMPALLLAQPKEVIDAYNLNQAIVKQDVDQVKELIAEGNDVNYQYNGRNALHAACDKDQEEIAALLIAAGAKVNSISEEGIGRTALQFVTGDVMKDQPGLADLLLKNGADPNLSLNPDQIPLFDAITHTHVGIVKVLLEHEAGTSIKNSMDLRPYEYVNYLIDRGVSDAEKLSDLQEIKDLLSK